MENAYIVKDDIEYGMRNVIPLWTFGFLYLGAVVERKQRAHGVCHGDLLIVGGNDDTDGQVVIRGQNAFEHFLPAVFVQLK